MLGHAHFGAGLYSDLVSLRLSSLLALSVGRHVHPSLLTLVGFFVGVATGVLAIAASDVRPTWLLGGLVVLGWQFAYVLDCADGQVARATGKTSASGAALDILCDFAVQTMVVVAVSTVVANEHRVTPTVIALFAATWMVNLVCGMLYRRVHLERHSLLPSNNRLVVMLKLSRDYGFLVLLLGLSYAFWRSSLPWLMFGILVVNSGFLLARIVNDTRRSLVTTRNPSFQRNGSSSASSRTLGGDSQAVHEPMNSS